MAKHESKRGGRAPSTPIRAMTGQELLAHLRASSGRNYVAGENQARNFAGATGVASEKGTLSPHKNVILGEVKEKMEERKSGFVESYPRVQFMYARSGQLDSRNMSLVTDPDRAGLKDEAKQAKHDRIEALVEGGLDVDEYGVIQGNRRRIVVEGREYEYVSKENPSLFEPRAYMLYSTTEEQHIKVTTERLIIADSDISFLRVIRQEYLREQQEQNPA